MRFKFMFCSKGIKAILTIKITILFNVIPLNNADNLFTAR